MHHGMKVSAFDLDRAKVLHVLLEEAHVARAAALLGITPAAASNALRRLREEFGDALLVKKGRGLVRTRLGEELRAPAFDVVASAERLLQAAKPFRASEFKGQLPIALAEHVAAMLLPRLDRLARARAPGATLAIAAIPVGVSDWLEQTGGVLVGPVGAFAAISPGDALRSEAFYDERYACVMRRGHPDQARRWNAADYARQGHVLVTPRGRSQHSDVDQYLAARGLSRRIARIVPSFTLALPLVANSDLITTMPSRYARQISEDTFKVRKLPFPLPALAMKIVVHPAHESDGRTDFIKQLLRAALQAD